MQLSLPRFREAIAGATYAPAVLPIYRRPRSRLEQVLKHGTFLVFCIALGLIYGLFYTLFPTFMLVYLAMPIAFLAIVVIWALPDTNRAPTKLLSGLFFALLLAMLIWPNYLAIQIPGLPWMTIRRLFAFPLVGIMLICISVSAHFRSDLKSVLLSVKPFTYATGGFMLVQFLTILWSREPFLSINVVLNQWVGITACIFAAAYVFRKPRNVDIFVKILLLCAFLLCAVGIGEFLNRGVLWANHIPSFLKVDEQVLANYLSARVRSGEYRVVTIFSVSLVLAEYLALVTPFVVHRIMTTNNLFRIAAWVAFDVLLLLVINLTQSRLGVLGWITAHAVYGCIWSYLRWRRLRTDIIGPALSLAASAMAALIFIGMFTIPAIRNRTIGGGATGMSDDSRRQQFEMLWPRLLENPFGYGGGNSGYVLGYFDPGGLLTVDSLVITFLIDYGVIGFFLFAFMLIYMAWKVLQIAWSKSPQAGLALTLGTVLVIAIQIRLVLSQLDNLPLVHIFLGLGAVLVWREHELQKQQPHTGGAA